MWHRVRIPAGSTRRRNMDERDTVRCSSCGEPVLAGVASCTACGASVAVPESSGFGVAPDASRFGIPPEPATTTSGSDADDLPPLPPPPPVGAQLPSSSDDDEELDS